MADHARTVRQGRSKLVQCPHCGKHNRVPAVGDGVPRCGNCRNALPRLTNAGDDAFADVAERASLPVLVEPPSFAKALSVSEVGHRCRARARGLEGAVTAGYRVPSRVMDPDVASIRDVVPRTPHWCEECLRMGTSWVHLRLCLTCGHVGCCDSSPMRHARAHAGVLGHPIVQSMEPGENWRCYVEEAFA